MWCPLQNSYFWLTKSFYSIKSPSLFLSPSPFYLIIPFGCVSYHNTAGFQCQSRRISPTQTPAEEDWENIYHLQTCTLTRAHTLVRHRGQILYLGLLCSQFACKRGAAVWHTHAPHHHTHIYMHPLKHTHSVNKHTQLSHIQRGIITFICTHTHICIELKDFFF